MHRTFDRCGAAGGPERPGRGARRIPALAASAALAVAAAFLAAAPAAAQSVIDASPQRPSAASDSGNVAPRAFRGIELGMARDEVIAALKKDSLYSYRGPEDVTLLPSPNQSLIDVSGLSFVKRAFFQFYEGKLWVMVFSLNPDRIDHYSVFMSLSSKYGEPGLLDPKEARWEDKATRVSLERPLTLRYMDMAAFGKLREGSAAKESVDEIDRKDFLGGL